MTRIHRISAAAALCLVLVCSFSPAAFAASRTKQKDQAEWTRRVIRVIKHFGKGIFNTNDEATIPKP
jgi:hypothetical protein